MGNQENVESAPGLGFTPKRKRQPEQVARPGKWSPGVRALSAEEYERFTNQLAQELLATCSLEHLAVIAAQHMIYADELKCVLEESKVDMPISVRTITAIAGEIAAEVAITAVRAHGEHRAEKRAVRVRAVKADVIALARRLAREKWGEDIGQTIRTGEMAEMLFRELKETEHANKVSSVNTVKRWIQPVTPDYAKRPGPGSRQSDNRND